MTILITGVRGGVGAGLLHRLHTSGADVRAASRAPEKTTPPAGVRTVALDLTDTSTFAPALAGVTDMFLYAEPAGIEPLLETAVAAGVRRVVLLSSDSVTLENAEHNALARHHLLVERVLEAAPVTTTVLRPGGFATMTLDWADAVRTGSPIEQAYPDARLDVVHPEDIVDLARLALTTDKLDDQTVTLGGPEMLSFRDQARVLGDLLGRDVELREASHEQATGQLSKHIPAPLAAGVLDYWAQLPGNRTEASRSTHQITGHPGRTFRQWATENLDLFR